MGEGKQREEWARTSHILAMMANASRDPKKRRQPYRPDEFNPTIPRKEPRSLTKEEARNALKDAFLSGALGWRGRSR